MSASNKLSIVTRTITPDVARGMLENHASIGAAQRGLSGRTVDSFAVDMLDGRWQMNGEPIIIGASGELLDGQHRLHAVIQSGCSIECVVVSGVEKSAFATIDTGRSRSGRDILGLSGRSCATSISATARFLMEIERHQLGAMRIRISPAQLLDFVEKHPEIERFYELGLLRHGERSIVKSSLLAALWCAVRDEWRPKCEKFIENVKLGENLPMNDPAMQLRNAFIIKSKSTSYTRNAEIGLVIKSWNLFATGQRVKVMVFKSSDAIPEIHGSRYEA